MKKRGRGRPKGSKSKVSRPRRPRHQFMDLLGPIKTNTPEGRRLYYRQLMRRRKQIPPEQYRIPPPTPSFVEERKLVDLSLLKPGAVEEILKILKGEQTRRR